MKTLRLVLAAEHALFRAGLRSLLESGEGIRVVAETGSGREAVVLAKHHRPGVVLLENQLAEISGLEAMAQILHFSPRSRVILLSRDGDEKTESRALDAGAAGVLHRNAAPRDLERLLRAVRDAGPEGTRAPAAEPSRTRRPKIARPGRGSTPLTPRQFEVLKLLSEGSGVKRIARLLGISAKTVETHRAQVMERLRIYDLVGLVRYALREKITRL
jgi:DNA-binding NarL/FixJ family response regulator